MLGWTIAGEEDCFFIEIDGEFYLTCSIEVTPDEGDGSGGGGYEPGGSDDPGGSEPGTGTDCHPMLAIREVIAMYGTLDAVVHVDACNQAADVEMLIDGRTEAVWPTPAFPDTFYFVGVDISGYAEGTHTVRLEVCPSVRCGHASFSFMVNERQMRGRDDFGGTVNVGDEYIPVSYTHYFAQDVDETTFSVPLDGYNGFEVQVKNAELALKYESWPGEPSFNATYSIYDWFSIVRENPMYQCLDNTLSWPLEPYCSTCSRKCAPSIFDLQPFASSFRSRIHSLITPQTWGGPSGSTVWISR